jgi:prepilin-type N-terminal cleavage/methylation domain-containing protein
MFRSGQAERGALRVVRAKGFTLIELTIAVALLAIAMTLTVQAVGWVAQQRRATDRRQWAAREAGNVMERLTSLAWDDIAAKAGEAAARSSPARDALPGGELIVAIDENANDHSKRIAVRIRWRTSNGGWEAPVRLTSWVYRDGRSAR